MSSGEEERSGPTPSTETVLDAGAIHALLAHRYPFLLVDRIRVVERGRVVVGTKRITAGEWWCAGADAPLLHMPLTLVVEALAQTSGALVHDLLEGAEGAVAYFMGVQRVRLRQAPRIGDELTWRSPCDNGGAASAALVASPR